MASTTLNLTVPAPDPNQPITDLEDWNFYLHEFVLNHGYALTIERSNTAKDDKEFIRQIYYRCDRGGKYRGSHNDRPNTGQSIYIITYV
jgi:hypothetical protein